MKRLKDENQAEGAQRPEEVQTGDAERTVRAEEVGSRSAEEGRPGQREDGAPGTERECFRKAGGEELLDLNDGMGSAPPEPPPSEPARTILAAFCRRGGDRPQRVPVTECQACERVRDCAWHKEAITRPELEPLPRASKSPRPPLRAPGADEVPAAAEGRRHLPVGADWSSEAGPASAKRKAPAEPRSRPKRPDSHRPTAGQKPAARNTAPASSPDLQPARLDPTDPADPMGDGPSDISGSQQERVRRIHDEALTPSVRLQRPGAALQETVDDVDEKVAPVDGVPTSAPPQDGPGRKYRTRCVLPLSVIREGVVSTRELRPGYVRDLVHALEADRELPPLVVDVEGNLVDGQHRRCALEKAGRTEAEVLQFQYDTPSARLRHAVELNAGHGRPFSGAEKKALGVKMFEAGMAHSEISQILAVSQRAVESWTRVSRLEKRLRLTENVRAVRQAGGSQEEIAASLGVTRDKVRGLLGEAGEKRRSSQSPNDVAQRDADKMPQAPPGNVPLSETVEEAPLWTDGPPQRLAPRGPGLQAATGVAPHVGRR